jgi:glutaredoxin
MGDLNAAISRAPVVFFEQPGCPYCRAAEQALNHAGIAFTKVPIDPDYRGLLMQRTGKR